MTDELRRKAKQFLKQLVALHGVELRQFAQDQQLAVKDLEAALALELQGQSRPARGWG